MKKPKDVPLARAQIIWHPEGHPELPPVKVIDIPGDDDQRYFSSWGACSDYFNKATDEERVHMLLLQFIHMAVTREVPAAAIHDAFMVIPEYRQTLADNGSLDPEKV